MDERNRVTRPLAGKMIHWTVSDRRSVANDPLNATDPSGAYICSDGDGGTIDCPDNIKEYITEIGTAADNAETEEAKQNLRQIADFYGTADEDNGVTVKLGDTISGAPAEYYKEGDQHIVGFDNTNLPTHANPYDQAYANLAYAGVLAHEGRHALNAAQGIPYSTRAEGEANELLAYQSQAYLHQYGQQRYNLGASSFVDGSGNILINKLENKARISVDKVCRFTPMRGC